MLNNDAEVRLNFRAVVMSLFSRNTEDMASYAIQHDQMRVQLITDR